MVLDKKQNLDTLERRLYGPQSAFIQNGPLPEGNKSYSSSILPQRLPGPRNAGTYRHGQPPPNHTPLFCLGRAIQHAFTKEYVVQKLPELAIAVGLGQGSWNGHGLR